MTVAAARRTTPAPAAGRPAGTVRADHGQEMDLLEPGLVPYRRAWDLQRRLVLERGADRRPDTLLLLEHPPVFTLGRRGAADHVLLDAEQLDRAGIEVVEVDRGGDVTYHGPGQLVAYPILRLAGPRHVVPYVRALEEAVIRTAARIGVTATRRAGLTGVWVGREKLCAIGVRVAAGGVTSHGLALNVAPDLGHFAGIVPCGLPDEGVCSLESLGVPVDTATVGAILAAELADEFGAPRLHPVVTA